MLLHARMQPEGARPRRLPPTAVCVLPEAVAARVVRAIRGNRGLIVIGWWARLLLALHRMRVLSILGGIRSWLRKAAKPSSEPNDISPPAHKRTAA
jgi:hypothetical protein